MEYFKGYILVTRKSLWKIHSFVNIILFDIHIKSVYNDVIHRIDWNSHALSAAAEIKIKRYVPLAKALLGQCFAEMLCA